MIQKCVSVQQLRIRTFWRMLCVFMILTLTICIVSRDRRGRYRDLCSGTHGIQNFIKHIVWTLSYDVFTSVDKINYLVHTDALPHKVSKSMRSSLLNIFKTSGDETNFTAVILLTYMRSGSSITGEILQQNEHVFYVFEPLRVLSHLIKTNQPLVWFNGTTSSVSTLNMTSVKKQALIGWLTCNFAMVPSQTFDDWYFLSFGKKTDVYNECILNHFGVRYKTHYENSSKTSPTIHIRLSAFRRGEHEKCLQELKNTCLSSKFRIIKTIRTSMTLADEVLSDVYGSKIIHLIRDPRSTVVSQAHYGGCPGGKVSVVACSNWHCKTVEEDTKFKQKILSLKPGRVLTTLIEDLSSHPINFSKTLYNFIGMEFSELISIHTRMITKGQNITGCKVCEQSWQSRTKSEIASRYNFMSMNSHLLSYIQSICGNTMKQYGYESYTASLNLAS